MSFAPSFSPDESPESAAAARAGDRERGERLLRRLDPSASLRALFALDDPPEGLAEEALIGWLIALPDGVDPADAARALFHLPADRCHSAEAERLSGLLEQVARFPAASLSRRRRRR
jgi:hypothetical protein